MRPDVQSACLARGVHAYASPTLVYDPFWSITQQEGATDEERRTKDVRRLRKAIDEVLEFGLGETARLERSGDLEGAVEMAEGLAGLKGRLLLAKD